MPPGCLSPGASLRVAKRPCGNGSPPTEGLAPTLSCIYQQVNQHWEPLFMTESKPTKNSTPPTEEAPPIETAKLRLARGLPILSYAIICTGLYTICLCALIALLFEDLSGRYRGREFPVILRNHGAIPEAYAEMLFPLAAIGMIIFSLLALICGIRVLYEFSKCKIILPQGAPGIIQAVICCLVLGAILSRSPRTFLQESPALSFFSFWSAQILIPLFIMQLCSHYQQEDLEKKCRVFRILSFFPVAFYFVMSTSNTPQGTSYGQAQIPLMLTAVILVNIVYMAYGIRICRTFSNRLKSGQLPEVEPTSEPPKDVKTSPSQ